MLLAMLGYDLIFMLVYFKYGLCVMIYFIPILHSACCNLILDDLWVMLFNFGLLENLPMGFSKSIIEGYLFE